MQSENPDAPTFEPTVTIGNLSQISGLSVSAIRFYQRRGLLPARDATGWQRFGHEVVDRLAVMELAKAAGFSLDEIARILDALDADPDSVPAQPPTWRGLAEHKLDDIDTRITRLEQMRALLRDALDYSAISPDRAAQVPQALGWVDGGADPELPPITVPQSAEALYPVDSPRSARSRPGR
jgi:MerR family redox-sensitive transcriptional activator SoxR